MGRLYWCDGVSGNLQGRGNRDSQVNGVSDTALACQLCGSVWRRVQKRNSGFCLPFCLEESCLPAFVWITDTSAPLLMPLVPFKLLLQCWSSERVNLSKSMCGFFKGNCLGLQNFLLLTQSPLVFAARSYGDLSSWHWNHGLGRAGMGLGLLAPGISLLNIYPPHMNVGPAHLTSLHHLPVWMDVVSLIL